LTAFSDAGKNAEQLKPIYECSGSGMTKASRNSPHHLPVQRATSQSAAIPRKTARFVICGLALGSVK
jgi:hypothetical protein